MKYLLTIIAIALAQSVFAQTDSVKVDTTSVIADSVKIAVDSTKYVSVAIEDTVMLAPGEKVHDMKEVDILAEKETQLTKAINAALKNSLELNAPGSMSLSDGIKKLTKYKSKKERRRKEVEENLLRMEQAKTFEELLNEAVELQKQLDEQEKAAKKYHK